MSPSIALAAVFAFAPFSALRTSFAFATLTTVVTFSALSAGLPLLVAPRFGSSPSRRSAAA